jgi:hypothetical protein
VDRVTVILIAIAIVILIEDFRMHYTRTREQLEG